jgi:RNA polymerase sigma-70 factor (ECF subfamily)
VRRSLLVTGKLVPFRPRDHSAGAAPTDEALLRACASGDTSALADLFERHGDRVHRVLARVRGVDRRDWDDLLQATFIEVYRSAARYESRASVATWILGIAVNITRHHVRGEVRRRALQAAVVEAETRKASRPDEEAARQQLLIRLEAALAALPPDLQLAFSMCELEGLKGVEVARILGMREGTLWRKLHEARSLLREALEPRGSV